MMLVTVTVGEMNMPFHSECIVGLHIKSTVPALKPIVTLQDLFRFSKCLRNVEEENQKLANNILGRCAIGFSTASQIRLL